MLSAVFGFHCAAEGLGGEIDVEHERVMSVMAAATPFQSPLAIATGIARGLKLDATEWSGARPFVVWAIGLFIASCGCL